MAAVRFFQSYSGGYTVTGSDSSAELSLNFSPLVDGTITSVWWRRGDATAGHKPDRLRLYDAQDGTVLLELTSYTDSGSAGWQETVLGAPIQVFGGRQYKMAGRWTGGFYVYNPSPYAEPAPPYGLRWGTTKRCYHYGGTVVDGTQTCDSSGWYALDVTADVGTTGQPPASSNDLTAWLADTSDNTHRAGDTVPGLPDTIKVAVDAAAADTADALANTAGLLASIDNIAAGDVATYGLSARTIGAAISGALGFIDTTLDVATKIHDLLSGNGTGGDTYDYHGALEDVRQKVYDIEARQLLALQPPPAATWVSQGTHAFDTNLEWLQEADLYTITYTDLGSNIVNLTIGAAAISYRLLWWAVWDGERMRERRFADGTTPTLYDAGARMPGIVLHSPAGAAGTIEAWLLT